MGANSQARPLPAGAVKAQVAKVLASERFARSPRLSRFLEFTVEQTLAGRQEQLKEYLIAVEVFGRKASFDPREDAIVRVQAVTLRARLAAYYETEGASDSVLIEYSKGSYVPVFRLREAQAAAAQSPDSIAVLPFVNMSSDPENEYFSDGLTEELISTLSNDGLHVVARTSVFQYKGKAADVRRIGAELNARMLLEGSVRKSGGRLRITVQLVDAVNGYHTWARTYRVEMKDLFTVQQEIARAISGTLREGAHEPIERRTRDLQAYHSYLRGRFYLNRWTEEGFRKAIGFFEDAIARDPSMAGAWSGLADAQFVLACYGKLNPREVMPKARDAAARALELGETFAEPHVSIGAVRAVYDWDWRGAEEEFKRAIELDPHCATAYQWYGVLCLIPQGRIAEAETAIRHACELDPLSPPINTSMGLVHFVQARYDEALACFARALEIDPNFSLAHWWTGLIYLNRSQLLKAFGAMRKAGALPRSNIVDRAFAYGEGLTGKGGKARTVLERLLESRSSQYVSPVLIASIYLVLGDKNAALEWLEKACDEHSAWLAWVGVDRRFDPLRSDARFAALVRRIGIGDGACAQAV